jgi:hypothetical protein
MIRKENYTSEWKLEHMGNGAWISEPDNFEFYYEGFKCRIKRMIANENSGRFFGGHLCGYVMIPKDHPLFNKDYSDIDDIDVHGGLTYGELENEDEYWIGFDCAHSNDIVPSMMEFRKIFEVEFQEKYKRTPTIFKGEYRTWDWVMEQTKSLADQVINFKG